MPLAFRQEDFLVKQFDLRHTLLLSSLEDPEPNVHRLFAAVVPVPVVVVLS